MLFVVNDDVMGKSCFDFMRRRKRKQHHCGAENTLHRIVGEVGQKSEGMTAGDPFSPKDPKNILIATTILATSARNALLIRKLF
jgi:hypothetical protein